MPKVLLAWATFIYMKYSDSPLQDCEQGHRVAGDNLYLHREGGRLTPKCRTCSGAPENTVDKRKHAARLARDRRARLKMEDPAEYERVRKRDNDLRQARKASMSDDERTALAKHKLDRRHRNRDVLRTLNVSVAEYHSLLEEETLTEVELARNQDRPSAAWNLLKVKGDALPAWDEFSEYLETTATPCQGSREWTEYDDPRTGREDEAIGVPMPGKNRAAEMCQQCPLIDLCQNFARKDKPDFGIWGGERWLGGKRV